MFEVVVFVRKELAAIEEAMTYRTRDNFQSPYFHGLEIRRRTLLEILEHMNGAMSS